METEFLGDRFRSSFRKRYSIGRISEAMRFGHPIREGCFASGADYATADNCLVAGAATVGCATPLFLVSLTHRVVGGRSSLRKPIGVHEQDSLGFALIFRNALSKVSVKDGAS